MHLLGKGLGGGVQALHFLLGVLFLAHGIFVVSRDLDGTGAQLFQLLYPDRHFQRALLIMEYEKLSGFLRLDTQGLHLQLQLFNLVVDAHQILVGAGQFALGLLLAVAEA